MFILKKSIPTSLRIQQICSTFQDYHSHSLNNFLMKNSKKVFSYRKLSWPTDQKQLLHQQKRHDKQCLPLLVTYCWALPNLKDILRKHSHRLQANQSFKKALIILPIIAFRKGASLKQGIGTATIHNNERLIKSKNNHHQGMPTAIQLLPFAVNNLLQQ